MQIGIKDMKVLAINAHLFSILDSRDPPLSSIKAQSAHRAMSQEEATRVRERWRERGGDRQRRGERRLSED